MAKIAKQQNGARVGLISRIDYDALQGRGFRKSVVDATFRILQEEQTNFNILVGGLINERALKKAKNCYVADEIRKDRLRCEGRSDCYSYRYYASWDRFRGLPKNELIKARKQELGDKFLRRVASDLSEIIPRNTVANPENPKKTKIADLFIITSPAFDGELGEQVAQMLNEIRPEIRLWNVGGDRFDVLYVDKLIWALTPTKAVWMRGDYYSTAAERVIKDKIKGTTQSSPDLYVVGCFGSNITKPKGELRYSYVTIPNCSRIEEIRVNENQIGVAVLEFPPDHSQWLKRNYNLKDAVGRELDFVVPPPGVSALQRKIIETIKTRGWVTPGILRYQLKAPVSSIEVDVKKLMTKDPFGRIGENWPGLVENKKGKKYYFNLPWIQRRLRYDLPEGPFNEDRMLTFACLHAGSVETDYDFFRNEVPKIILEREATVFVGAGDLKESNRHNLDRKGELIPGMIRHDIQEKFAANLIGAVITDVFKTRFTKTAADLGRQACGEKLKSLIDQSLLSFFYIPGNHDLWESDEGHEPLVIFRFQLLDLLIENIEGVLGSRNLRCSDLREIVSRKIQRQAFFTLPSGLKVSVQHPPMARAKTTSLRPQEMLDFGKRFDCQISIGGNFHTSETVEEWDMDLGQCVCVQNGTIKHGSNFERNRMKMVDQGVGYLRVVSEDRRILMTENAFYGQPRPRLAVDNLSIVNSFVERLNIPSLKYF